MKKLLSVVLVVVMLFAMTACSSSSSDDKKSDTSDIKIGAIFIGDENEGYTAAHYEGMQGMLKNLGLDSSQLIIKWNIPEGDECLTAAEDLVDLGCTIIFANSFGHEDYILEAAEEFPDVEFCHATGYQATSSGLSNMHNYFTSVYESRYVSGVVAGLKLNEMIEKGDIKADAAKIGYVGAYPFAEVISGYTAFFLGVKSVCETATMEVQFTSSWANQALEKQTAEALIADGCVLISQHADTVGAPTACEEAKVPCVGYNISMIAAAPNAALTSASIDWAPYYTYAVKCVMDGDDIVTDWCKGYNEGADKITPLNDATVAEGTAEKVAEVEEAIKNGELQIFDTSKFTIGGKSLEEYLEAEGIEDANVYDGAYHESTAASAPSFAYNIDGITQK